MAQPVPYNRETDFTQRDGDDTDHAALNRELDDAATSINQLRDNLELIQRDDGQLKSGIVGADQLAPSAFDAVKGELSQAVSDAQNAAQRSEEAARAAEESETTTDQNAQAADQSAKNAASSAASAASAAQYQFNGIYFGPHATDPVLDPNGNPPGDGDFYYNTVAKTWRAYDGATDRWVAPILSGQFKRALYMAGTGYTPGVTTTLVLPGDPQTVNNLFIHFDGIFQQFSDFSLAGLVLTLKEPIPVGVAQVEVAYIEAVNIEVTDSLMSYATRAAAAAAAAQGVDGQAWEVRADELNAGKRSRGIFMGKALVTQQVEDFTNRANHYGTQAISTITGLSDATPEGVMAAIGSSATYTAVPATYKADAILVKLPHLRAMVWDGAKYIRAPWHPVGKVSFSYGATLAGHLPIRADLSYNQADYPDLAVYLGLSGTGTFSLIEARGEFIRVLDNGRGKDVGRVIRSTQADAIREHTHNFNYNGIDNTNGYAGIRLTGNVEGGSANTLGISGGGGTETRPSNIALPLWISY